VPTGGHCPSCSAETFGDDDASASTQPIPGPPPRGLGPGSFRIAPGQRFGERFTLVEEIGAGGMGQVYKAIDVTLGKTVALKLVRARSGAQEQTMERFRRELTLAREVTHPNVCRVYDLGEIDGTLFISMEYVEGQSLDDLIQSVGTLSTKQTIAIARQICAGLEAIHFRKIVHRDLKPANIMVDRAGHPILMDFGLAYAHGRERLTGEGAILGTLAYISPEQAVGQATDTRTDIYALGLILYEMLTGRRAPGDGGTAPLALRDSGERCPPPSRFSPDVPGELDAIVLRCLERDPARRYASCLELEEALARLAATLSSGVSAGRVRIPRGRGPAASVTAAAVVLAALGGAGGWWKSHQPRAVAGVRPVVAVLPLENVSRDPADDYLGVGLADTLITRLAALPAVTVVSRSATLEQRGRPTAAVAKHLGATYLVSGGVQRADRRLRVTLNLVRPDDSVAWGKEYDGHLDDVFALHRVAAESLSEALQVSLSDTDRQRLARPPTSDGEAFAMYSHARALLERPDVPGNVPRSIDALEKAIQRDPRFALAHAALGEAQWARYLETRDVAAVGKAQDAITEALRLDPDQPLTRIALALVYRGTNRGPQAAEELRRILVRRPADDEAHRLLGEILLDQGRAEDALAELRKAIEERPGFWRNHASLGQALLRGARYQEAAAAFQRAIELQPDNSRAFQMLGTVYSLMADDERAVVNYRRAIELAPDSRAYSNLGTTYYRQGKFADAARAYEDAVRLEPHSPAKYRNLGDVYARLGQRERARQAYLRAVELSENLLRVNPGDARTLGLMALSESKLGHHGPAARHAEEARRLSPADGEVLYRNAVVAALAGHPDAALSALDQALSRGYSAADAARDDDFGTLRDTPAFRQLVIHPRPGTGKGGM
jgi:tetratricopeptide (TPR) repeat protein/tRNA A-37 threonylcarbamoyl transferase component Bud32